MFKKLVSNNKGFTMIEILISSAITLVVMGSILTLLVNFTHKSTDDQSRSRQIQESRFVLNILSSDLHDAGAVLTLANFGGFLTTPAYFTGIYPLNRVNAPDGIIIAAGDPDAVTSLAFEFTPSSSNDIPVMHTNVNSDGGKDWESGDYGIVIAENGYYVFEVDTVDLTGNTITKRSECIYYSGLLNDNSGYIDTKEGSTTNGDMITYPVNAPVIRIAKFSIYLIREQYDESKHRNRRDLVRIVDTFENSNILDNPSTDIKQYVMAQNIWDIQIGYTSYPDLPALTNKESFFLPGSTGILSNLLPELQAMNIREIEVNIVALTEDFSAKHLPQALKVPAIGDSSEYTLPQPSDPKHRVFYDYKIYKMMIQPKNFVSNTKNL